MNVFEAVKQTVTTRQAAENYGIHVNRAGNELHPKSWTHRPTIGGAVLWEKNFSQKNLK